MRALGFHSYQTFLSAPSFGTNTIHTSLRTTAMEATASRRLDATYPGVGGGVSVETALLDQRMRAEKHRTNFESLKAQHLRLQEVHEDLQRDRDEVIKNYHQLASRSEQIISQLQQERDAKVLECEQLRMKVLAPQKLKELREEIAQEIGDTFRQELNALEGELDVMKGEHHKLQYSYQFLKSEYEASKSSYESLIGELKTKHHAEVQHFKREVKDLRSRLERDTPTEIQRIRELQRSNSELQERLRVLCAENEELRAEQLHNKNSSDQSQLQLRRELMEVQTVLQGLQIEKSSLQEQLTSARNQLDASHREQHSLTEQVSLAQRQLAALKRKLDEQQQQHQKELGESRMRHQQELGELQREKERVAEEGEAIRTKCSMLQSSLQQMKSSLADKERQMEADRHGELQKEWDKTMALERARLELEEQLAEANRAVAASREECEGYKQRLQEQVTQQEEAEAHSDAQLKATKAQLSLVTGQSQQQEREIAHLMEVSRSHKELLKQHERLTQLEHQAHEEVERLTSTLRTMEEQFSSVQLELANMRGSHEEELNKLRCEREEERKAWRSRAEEMSTQLKDATDKLTHAHKSRKKANRHHKSSVQEMHRLLELAQSREKELILEKEKEKRIAEEKMTGLKKHLHSVRRQQQQFLLLLNTSPDTVHLMEGIGGVGTSLSHQPENDE